MSSNSKDKAAGTMLELWRPPAGAGDPIGCITSTYTFTPGIFDEQCLARFLEIESEPNREDLAFLLEREARLGGIYAGVLVDASLAGVEHSLRWDVLPVRIPSGKQHAKLSLLRWSKCIRIIVSSANLTEQGYRANFEVATAVDFTEGTVGAELIAECVQFLEGLITFVPGAERAPAQVERARGFLADIVYRTQGWTQTRRGDGIRRRLACTLPGKDGSLSRSTLEELIGICRTRGTSPHQVRIASPFYDMNGETDFATKELCKKMASGRSRHVTFAIPTDRGQFKPGDVPRLCAPAALLKTARNYVDQVDVEILPTAEDKNFRPWHAKMMALTNDSYFALMIGSSNFTTAGLGLSTHRNTEANLLTVVDRVEYGRDAGKLSAIWPEVQQVSDPGAAEWIGPNKDLVEEEQMAKLAPPPGFLFATFEAGDNASLILHVNCEILPQEWTIRWAQGQKVSDLISSQEWKESGSPSAIRIIWQHPTPPETLIVRWSELEALLPINIDDPQTLPPPTQLERMTADDMLGVLAAADPSAAIRAWSRTQARSSDFDEELDSASQIEIDPLQRYELCSTFLHRIRRRARILMQLRANLERPLWGMQALEWRLHGVIGIEALASRLFDEFKLANGSSNEALLTLADFLVVLRETDYQGALGAVPKATFEIVFWNFLKHLAAEYGEKVKPISVGLSADAVNFWERVVELCQS
jgi:hypothetical protein